jgi:hypothetical protein
MGRKGNKSEGGVEEGKAVIVIHPIVELAVKPITKFKQGFAPNHLKRRLPKLERWQPREGPRGEINKGDVREDSLQECWEVPGGKNVVRDDGRRPSIDCGKKRDGGGRRRRWWRREARKGGSGGGEDLGDCWACGRCCT